MSRNPDDIRREIEATRGQLAQNLEAIGDKVSPKHVVEQISDKVSPRRILNRQTEKVKDSLSGVGDSVLGRASGTANGVQRSVGGVVGTASGTGNGARQQAATFSERVRSASTSASDQLRSAPESNPMATALVAFGAGLVVGLALPPTDKEREAAGAVRQEMVEPLKQQAVQAGKSVAGELQPSAQSKVQRVKRTATGAATRVKQDAKGAADDVRGQAGETAQSVRAQAKRATRSTQSRAKAAAGTTKSTAKRSPGQVRQRASV